MNWLLESKLEVKFARRYKGGGGGTRTVVKEVQAEPAPAPPQRGEAARLIKQRGVLSNSGNRVTGRRSTMLAPRGSLEDQVQSLLGG